MLGGLGLIIVTGGIFFVWYLLFSLWGLEGERTSDRLIVSGMLSTAQIILSEIFLGQLGFLRLIPLISLNAMISVTLFLVFISTQKIPLADIFKPFQRVLKVFPAWWRNVNGWEIWILMGLIGIWGILIIGSSFLYPPRGMDDVYHLPPIYSAFQESRISILPLELRYQFAYPQNGELLFLWPLLFFGDVRVVDLVQFVLVFFACLAIYSMATRFGSSPRVSLFVALLFPFLPIVIGQAGTAYIDLIVSVYFLGLLALAVIFWQGGRLTVFYTAGLVCGLLIGMKYSMVFLVLGAQPLLFYPLWKGFGRRGLQHGVIYLALLFVGGAYWYLRNFLVLGSFWDFSI